VLVALEVVALLVGVLFASKTSISSLLAIPSLVSYPAKAKARPTATVSSFSNAFSLLSFPKELQVKVHLAVFTVALKQASSHCRVKVVSIEMSPLWSS
jgi:hypothetical protein